MMSMIITFLMLTSIMILIYSKNPMKASFSILIASSMMFLTMKMKTGLTWIPLIFFILFTGGILMVFMILASILPNEKVGKMKTPKNSILILMAVAWIGGSKMVETTNMSPQMKTFISSSLTLTFMIALILIYFFCAVNLNTDSETSMRSLTC